jgi:hypothetical protein
MAGSRCSADPGSNAGAVRCRWPAASPGDCSPTSAWSTRRHGTTWRRCCSRSRTTRWPPCAGRCSMAPAPAQPGWRRGRRGARLGRVGPGHHRPRRRAGPDRPGDPGRPVRRLAARARRRDPHDPGRPDRGRGVGPPCDRPVPQGPGRAASGPDPPPPGPPPTRRRRPADQARRRRPGAAGGRPGEVRRRRLPGRAGDGSAGRVLRGRDQEALGLLRRAQQLAGTVDHPELLADTEREIGYVGLLEARYGAAEEALQRSIAAPRRSATRRGRPGPCSTGGCASRTGATTGRRRPRSSSVCMACPRPRWPGGPTGRRRWPACRCGRDVRAGGRDRPLGRRAGQGGRRGGAGPVGDRLGRRGRPRAGRRGGRRDDVRRGLHPRLRDRRPLLGGPGAARPGPHRPARAAGRPGQEPPDRGRRLLPAPLRRLPVGRGGGPHRPAGARPGPDEAETARALRLATAGPMPDLFERLRNRSRLQTPTQTGGR